MVANKVENEIEWPLTGFIGGNSGRKTDVKAGILSNRDACLLLLFANGGVSTTGTLRRLLQAWRPLEGITYRYNKPSYRSGKHELHFSYLFNSYYGHICGNIEGRPMPSYYGGCRTKEAFFWSAKRGEIRITHAGYKRLAWLLTELGRECKTPDCIMGLELDERYFPR